MIIFFILFTIIEVSSSQKKCQSIALTVLNPESPLVSNINDYPEQTQTLSFCNYLSNNQSCCKSSQFDIIKKNYEDARQEAKRRNLELIYLQTTMMVDILRNQDQILKMARQLNTEIKNANNQSSSLRNSLDNLSNNPNFVNATSNESLAQKIKLPPSLEKYRNDLVDWETQAQNQQNQTQNQIDQAINFSIFNDTTFFSQNNGLGEFDIDQIQKEFTSIQIRMRNYVNSTQKCFETLFKHTAGVKCGICDPNEDSIFGLYGENLQFYFRGTLEMCDQLVQQCYGWVDAMDDFNNNINMYLLSTLAQGLNNSTNSSSIQYLGQAQRILAETLPRLLYYNKSSNCVNQQDCNYICQKLPTSVSINFSDMFVDRFYIKNFEALSQLNQNLFQTQQGVRILSEAKIIRLIKGDSALYIYQNSINTMEQGVRSWNDFYFDGTSGLNIFNLSGTATKEDLDNYKLIDTNSIVAKDSTYGGYLKVILGLILMIII